MSEISIIVKDVTKEYQRGDRVFKAVDTVNLSIESGDFISIIGKSGSGKSTLLNIIAGLITPTYGNVEVDGEILSSFSDSKLSSYRNEKIGYIPQWQSTLAGLTVLDNVRLPFYLVKRQGNSIARAHELLHLVSIAHLARSYPKHLSGGELKRVAIARALINDPDIIIADEPTGDLDRQTTSEVLELLQTVVHSGKAVLFVTHDLNAVRYGNRSFIMESGTLSSNITL